MKKKIMLFLILIGLANYQGAFIYAQNIDSVLLVVKSLKDDTNKVNKLNKLSNAFLNINSIDSAYSLANQSAELAQKLNFRKGLASAYRNLGNINYKQYSYEEAIKYYSKTLSVYLELNDKLGVADSYNDIARGYEVCGDASRAIENFNQALKYYTEVNQVEGIAVCQYNLGRIYKRQGNYTEALKYYFNSLQLYEKSAIKYGIADSYVAISNVYQLMGNNDDVLKNAQKAIEIYKEINDRQGVCSAYDLMAGFYFSQKNYTEALNSYNAILNITDYKPYIAASYINMGLVYHEQKKFDDELTCNFKALKIYEEIDYREPIAVVYNNISSAYLGKEDFRQVEFWAKKSIKEGSKTRNLEVLRSAYLNLSTVGIANRNYRQALEDYQLHIVYRDSLINEDAIRETEQIKMQYEFDKKDAIAKEEQAKKDELAAAEKRRQQIVIISVSILALLLFILAFVILKALRNNQQKNRVISQQKKLVEEKNKEITASITYAKRLQQAILPPLEYIEQFIPQHFILYKPKDIVAGDFYWAESIDGMFFIAAADSTGHGVPGAMVSVVCSNALNRAVKEFHLTEPGQILDKARDLVLETFAKGNAEVKDGMDISLLCINKKQRLVSWSGANNPLWYALPKSSEIKEIKANKQPIGKTDNPEPFITHSVEYVDGAVFYLFSDGYADQFGGSEGKKFKRKSLSDLLLGVFEESIDDQKNIVEKTFEDWKGNYEQVDDVCVIGIRI